MDILEPSMRTFTATLDPINLTAGRALAKLLIGTVALQAGTTAPTLATFLGRISEAYVKATFRGKSHDLWRFENGNDLWAFNMLCPWMINRPYCQIPGADNENANILGLQIPLGLPPAKYSGAYILGLEVTDITTTDNEKVSVAEVYGGLNMPGLPASLLAGKVMTAVKRLFSPSATGWNEGIDIAEDGDLIGLLCYQTSYPKVDLSTSDPTAVSIKELIIKVGGADRVHVDFSTYFMGQNQTALAHQSNGTTDVYSDELQKYFFLDLVHMVGALNCRGKAVKVRTNAGVADAIRVYPIYLI